MSAKRQWTDDRHDEQERDPHGIVPESFYKRYRSIQDAEREVERIGQLRRGRCPDCDSLSIVQKTDGYRDLENRRPEACKCSDCGAHFDELAESIDEREPGTQVSLEEVDGE
jgi:DNA-directed RNA polymerase subunit RPC12/RpoP